jgi:hypothetical protein
MDTLPPQPSPPRLARRCPVAATAVAHQPTPAPQPTYKFEKCYGFVKSGSCDKIVGGSATPKQS